MGQGWVNEDSFAWDKVNTEAPPPLEKGVYKCVVVKADAKPLGKDKKPGVSLELSAIEAVGKGSLDKPAKLFDNLLITQEAAFKVKQISESGGIEPPATNRFGDVEEFANRLLDAPQVFVRVKHEPWEGKMRARVDRYFSEEQAIEAANGGTAGGGDAPVEAERPQRRKRGA